MKTVGKDTFFCPKLHNSFPLTAPGASGSGADPRRKSMPDHLVKLLFTSAGCRGEVLSLGEAWTKAVARQHFPEAVERMLGEMAAGALLLAASLDFKGALVLQIAGDGPVKLAIVEVRTGLVFRATVQLRGSGAEIPADTSLRDLVNVSGNGRCALILDAADRAPGTDPSQGIVSLDGETVREVLETYMTRSEQIPTRLWLAASSRAVGGVMVQRIAREGGTGSGPESSAEIDETVVALAGTVTSEELLTLDALETSRRLFWESNPRVTAELTPSFGCRCSRSSIESMIQALGRQEAGEILAEQGKIEVRCEFCGETYTLDAIDVERLFASPAFRAPGAEGRG